MKYRLKSSVFLVVMILIVVAIPKFFNEALLSYISGALTFIGTMYLGWVAKTQNDELLKREDENYLANNSCMAITRSIQLEERVPELDWEEPIYLSQKRQGSQDSVFLHAKLIADYTGQCPVYGRIVYLKMFFGGTQEYTRGDKFSLLRISFDQVELEFNVAVPKKSYNDYVKNLSNLEDSFMVHLKYMLVTDKMVSTEIGCGIWMNFHINNEGVLIGKSENKYKPSCKWLGNRIFEQKDIKLKGIDERNNVFY